MTHSSSRCHQDQGRGDGDVGKIEEQSEAFLGGLLVFVLLFVVCFIL